MLGACLQPSYDMDYLESVRPKHKPPEGVGCCYPFLISFAQSGCAQMFWQGHKQGMRVFPANQFDDPCRFLYLHRSWLTLITVRNCQNQMIVSVAQNHLSISLNGPKFPRDSGKCQRGIGKKVCRSYWHLAHTSEQNILTAS